MGVAPRVASIARVVELFRPQVESMEGAAFMYACLIHQVPFAQIRAVSNVVEKRNRAAWKMAEAIQRLKARRVVIDSLSGFELALAPTFREDFRESLYRLVAALTGMGVTVMMTAELEDSYTDLRFSPHGTAFLTDAIVLQRYLELEGQLKRVMMVVKVRASAHQKDLRLFEITAEGIVVGERIGDYRGLLTGSPHMVSPGSRQPPRPRTRRPKS